MDKLSRRTPGAGGTRDGWGSNPDPKWNHANAIHLADTPVTNRLLAEYPHVLIHTSGEEVGPAGRGNGATARSATRNIGAGRIVDQEIMRITRRVRDGSFFEAPAVLVEAFAWAGQTGGKRAT